MSDTPLLQVDDLRVVFEGKQPVHVLNGVSLEVREGECLAVLGESGSGKSVTAQAVMGILPQHLARIDGGRIAYQGADLLTMSAERRVALRGSEIAMVFQDALTALNPVYRIGDQITEVYRLRTGASKRDARKKALELLDQVRIPDAENRIRAFPHQLSGGMRQRVMIAMALALDPRLLIADEPTTALDVTVQAEILELLQEIRRERNMGMILITHDMGVVSQVADRVAVMYAGKVVESGPTERLFRSPAHPYTHALIRSMPSLSTASERQFYIAGTPPILHAEPVGCSFAARCPIAETLCRGVVPDFVEVDAGHSALCHFPGKIQEAQS